MRTIRTKVYQFSELSEPAQKKAIEWFLNSFDDSFAWTDVKEDAGQIGLKLISLDNHRANEGKFMLAANEVAQNILNENGAMCETYKTAESFMNEWQPVFADYMDETSDKYESPEAEETLQELEDNFLQSLLEDYRIMLDKQIEYEYSDEFAKDTIEANEYEFKADGTRY